MIRSEDTSVISTLINILFLHTDVNVEKQRNIVLSKTIKIIFKIAPGDIVLFHFTLSFRLPYKNIIWIRVPIYI